MARARGQVIPSSGAGEGRGKLDTDHSRLRFCVEEGPMAKEVGGWEGALAGYPHPAGSSPAPVPSAGRK